MENTMEQNTNLLPAIKGDKIALFACHLCNKKFARKRYRDRHIECVHLKSSFTCPLCCKNFAKKTYRDRHVQNTHIKSTFFKCSLCGGGFGTKNTLDFHVILIHTSFRPFDCSNCHYRSLLKSYFLNHIERCCKQSPSAKVSSFQKLDHVTINGTVEEDISGCPLCGLCYKGFPMLIEHMKNNHGHSGSKEYCNKTIKKCERKREHQKIAKRRISRDIKHDVDSHEHYNIQEETKNSENTGVHENISDTNIPDCSLKSTNKQQRETSLRKESKDKPHENDQGTYESIFKISSVDLAKALTLLDQQLALEDDLTKYKCKFCSVTCLNSKAFDIHMQRHQCYVFH